MASNQSVNQSSAYIPMDRRLALAEGRELPQRTHGAALFADISGFTPLTEALAVELGPRRGAEELTLHLNRVYDALIGELHRYGGSVIGFSGDAITCWLDGDNGHRATSAALAMQTAMAQFAEIQTASGRVITLTMKAAVVTGPVIRFVVGDPAYRRFDTMAGTTLERLAAAENTADSGDVVVDEAVVNNLGDGLEIAEWRIEEESGQRFAAVTALTAAAPETP
ncbi:adenylate/guanylate cyclase domain-containing protein [Chloroflexi bacterium TSY]|nr:adenylate/guanylate cyclase domain-containing protein [Chloroflexi bacterium TSY]